MEQQGIISPPLDRRIRSFSVWKRTIARLIFSGLTPLTAFATISCFASTFNTKAKVMDVVIVGQKKKRSLLA